MIYFLAKRGALRGIRTYLDVAGRHLTGRVKPTAYETLFARMISDYWLTRVKEAWWEMSYDSFAPLTVDGFRTVGALAGRLLRTFRAPRRLPRGTYVFADVERLSPEETVKADVLWRALAQSGGAVRLLNHPARSMRRYELLRNLYEHGVNRFNVYRLTEARWPERYPVFLRQENDHLGPRSPILPSRDQLEETLRTLDQTGCREGMLITEFCDTADPQGIYRKYGAFIIGDRVFPKHLTFSRYWANQGPDLTEDDMLAEERQYVERNPHEAALRKICRLARIEYGKIDYGILDGQLQVWEIATNPTIDAPKARRHPARLGLLERFDEQVGEALERIAGQ
jgi:hypothetical protein